MQDCHVMMAIMRIEQQIDRMGQEADKIVIGNLCIADTIDTVINIESSLISSNDIKIVSRMEAIKNYLNYESRNTKIILLELIRKIQSDYIKQLQKNRKKL